MTIRQNLLNANYEQFLQEIVPNKPSPMITLHNKHFFNGLFVREILSNGTIGLVDVSRMLNNAITLDTTQKIYSSIYFKNATFKSISSFETLNGKTPLYFQNVVLKNTPVVRIFGAKNFHNDMMIVNLNSNGIVNQIYNITKMATNTLLRHSLKKQVFTESISLMNPVKIANLLLSFDLTWINGYPLSRYIILTSNNLRLVFIFFS